MTQRDDDAPRKVRAKTDADECSVTKPWMSADKVFTPGEHTLASRLKTLKTQALPPPTPPAPRPEPRVPPPPRTRNRARQGAFLQAGPPTPSHPWPWSPDDVVEALEKEPFARAAEGSSGRPLEAHTTGLDTPTPTDPAPLPPKRSTEAPASSRTTLTGDDGEDGNDRWTYDKAVDFVNRMRREEREREEREWKEIYEQIKDRGKGGEKLSRETIPPGTSMFDPSPSPSVIPGITDPRQGPDKLPSRGESADVPQRRAWDLTQRHDQHSIRLMLKVQLVCTVLLVLLFLFQLVIRWME